MALYVYEKYNTTEGVKKVLKQIECVYVNTVKFSDQTTGQKSMLMEVDDWIDPEDCIPTTEVICIDKVEDMMIGYFMDSDGYYYCENDVCVLNDVTHWKPKPFTPKEIRQIFNK